MIPIKIVTKEEIEKIIKKENLRGKGGTLYGYGVIGNKKTGKIVEVHKINRLTGKKTIMFRDINDALFKKKKGGAK